MQTEGGVQIESVFFVSHPQRIQPILASFHANSIASHVIPIQPVNRTCGQFKPMINYFAGANGSIVMQDTMFVTLRIVGQVYSYEREEVDRW